MKKLSILVLLMAFSIGLFALPVSLESAKSVAVNFYKNYAVRTSNYTINDVITYNAEQITTFYVFVFKAGGFVIVSADDAVTPILGYSTTETFDKNNIPVAAKNWYKSYSNQIKYIIDQRISNVETVKEWNKIKNNQFEKSLQAVSPLCTTSWDQSSPYNQLCPTNTYTGCVATAMAQIMKKWNYPTTGVGTHSYTDPTYGTLTANFGATTYAWANMTNTYSGGSSAASKTAVATLMFHCGVSVNMTYGTSGSGAYSWDVPTALINYFNYSPTAEIKFLADFTTPNWITMLKAELDASRPVYYSGDNGTEGHAFVCDGYNASSQFHFNWGWSGSSNGYYAIGNLNPGGYTFNLDNSVVVRIKPPSAAPIADFIASTITPPIGGTVTFTNNSTNNPTTWSWVFDGGTPSTSTLQTPPIITYNTGGIYQVSLTVTNGNGTDTKVRSSYINVGGTPSAWIKQNTGFTTTNRGIEQIFIVNPYIVWAKAYNGTSPTTYIREFTRTKNGGITWTPGIVTFTNSTNYDIANIHAFNDSVAILAMMPTGANGGMIVKTTDGGTTWSTANSPNYATSWLDFVHFFDTQNGVCVGDPSGTDYVIYTTSNGGNTWTLVPVANIPNCTSGETGIVGFFDAVGNTIWFGTSAGRVYKSTDKGLNWTVATTGFSTTVQTDVSFKNANVGIAIGSTTAGFQGLKKTIDGGTTWATITPTGYYVKYPQIDYVPGTTALWVDVAAGPSKGSSYSINDCTTFLNIDTGSVQYTCVKFQDYNTGWAGGFNASSSDGGIYKWAKSTPVPAITGTLTYCTGSNTTLNAGVYSSYLWSTSATTQTITATTANNPISVTVTDANGCTGTSTSIYVAENALPTPVIAGSLSYCTGFSTTLDAGVYNSYLWSTTATTQTINATVANNPISVQVTDANGCIGTSASVNVSQGANLTPSITGSLTVCTGGSTTLDAGSSGYSTYTWSTGATTQTMNVTTAGTYSVTVTDANGCTGSASVNVTENTLPTVTAGVDQTVCAGTEVTLSGSGATSYTWDNGVTNGIPFAPLSTITYSVIGTDVNGCSNTDQVIVNVNAVDNYTVSVIDPTASVTVLAGATYQWIDCDNGNVNIPGATSNDYTATVNGNYGVVVTQNGCTSTSSCVHIIALGISQNQNSDAIKVYPNPTNDFVNVEFPSVLTSKVIVNVYNILGEKILSQEIALGTNVAKLNLSDKEAGIYMLTINIGTKVITKRISKIK